jgi:hypothetical protein
MWVYRQTTKMFAIVVINATFLSVGLRFLHKNTITNYLYDQKSK